MRAYAFTPGGAIGFGNRIPEGATVIARGPEKPLRDFIAVCARHHQPRAGAAVLLVPGMPEAESPITAIQRLQDWCRRIAENAPTDVRVLPR